MGFFNKLFSNDSEPQEDKQLSWKPLNHVMQLDTIKERSNTKLQVIFKHSTRCGISRMVINQFVKQYSLTEVQADLYYLDLLNFREVSNDVASTFQVWHESPQLLVIKGGKVVTHASHSGINELDLKSFI